MKVVHDGTGPADPAERCAFCRSKTRFWFAPKDVAVCQECALTRAESEVPSKRAWIDRERRLTDGWSPLWQGERQ
jgi:hypothetical protein